MQIVTLIIFIAAETWFAVLFTVMVEVVPTDVRSIVIAIFLFLMNNIGGQVRFRECILIFDLHFSRCFVISGILVIFLWFVIDTIDHYSHERCFRI